MKKSTRPTTAQHQLLAAKIKQLRADVWALDSLLKENYLAANSARKPIVTISKSIDAIRSNLDDDLAANSDRGELWSKIYYGGES